MSNKKSTFIGEHLIIAGASLFILLGLLYLSSLFMEDFSTDSITIFGTEFLIADIQPHIIQILFIVVSVLVSYLIYLLLSLRTRAELTAAIATRSLSNSLAHFEKLYEEAPVPYVILNEKGEIIKPNKATLRFFGVVLEEIEGKNLFSLCFEEDQEKAEKLFRYYKSNLPINSEEIRLITKKGAVKWVLLSVFGETSFNNLKKARLGVIFDITERKQLDQAKTEFVSLASHQLRTPVSTIRWYTDMLLSNSFGELSGEQKEYVETIHKVNQGMIELIDTLLNVSRIEMGSLKIDLKPTNVSDLVESVLVELSSQIEEKNINIEKNYGGNFENIESDPKLLRIVIQNLISNAVKYTQPNGTVSITLKDSFKEKAIVVTDTGVGIPEKDQEKIFTKLFRAGNVDVLSSSQGTGLGLYLVKSIMETMGGSISFVSEENKGSTFTITI